MLRKRIITAAVSVLVVVFAAWFGRPLPWFTVLAVVGGGLACLEFYRMTGVIRALPLTIFGVAWTLFFIINPHLLFPVPLVLTAGLVLSLVLLVFSPYREGAFEDWAWMVAGILYTGWLLSYLVALRLEAGPLWVLLALFVTFGSDTAAYFVGRALGRHKLAPSISPGKTIEGAVAGILGGVIIAILFALPTPYRIIGYGEAVLLGVLVSFFGQLGDLAESLLKRTTGVKDSGTLMPGHGGLLDRMDSVIFAGVVVYYYFLLMAH